MTLGCKILLVLAVTITATVCQADPSAYIERWATGTLTTGEPFESWRIHIIVPDGDDWVASGIDGWTMGGSTWYIGIAAGVPAPWLFDTHPDAEFDYYYTSPSSYPNTGDVLSIGFTADGILEPNFVHVSSWFDSTFETDGDYVVWQGTVLNPTQDAYAYIEFFYVMRSGDWEELTFTIPEPATALLVVLAAGCCWRVRT